MRRIGWLLVLAACTEHGQSPSSDRIALSQVRCEREDTMFLFRADTVVSLDVGQAFTVTFLSTVEGGTFQQSTLWECDELTPASNNFGCERSELDPDRSTTNVTEVNQLVQGFVPTTFEFTTVASITDVPRGTELENVLVKKSCP